MTYFYNIAKQSAMLLKLNFIFFIKFLQVVCRLKEDLSADAQTEPLVGIDPNGTRIKCAVSRSLLPVNAALANDVLENIKKYYIFCELHCDEPF